MRRYSEAERDNAVARALAVGDDVAAAELGIPRRTISSWHHRPAQQAVILASREQLVDRYREAEALALERVIAGLQNKRTPVHHAARALEALATQRALLTGQSTANNFNLNADAGSWPADMTPEQMRATREFIDMAMAASDEMLEAEMPAWLAMLSGRDELAQRLANEIKAGLLALPEPKEPTDG